ncbi:unnamed protein product, partial [Didymodactylos carnosus]
LLPFLQQVSMHAALESLLILTIHRCYPAGVPKFLQGDFVRKQIRNYQTTIFATWLFAVLINIPLVSITKYRTDDIIIPSTNATLPSCDTEANQIWSITYLILILVLTYLVTGTFLIIIYGQVIRLILASKKFTEKNDNNNLSSITTTQTPSNTIMQTSLPKHLSLGSLSSNQRGSSRGLATIIANSTKRHSYPRTHNQNGFSDIINPSHHVPFLYSTKNQPLLSSPNDRRLHTQRLQVTIMLFIVIVLYIILLLPYRLFNLLFILHYQIFENINELLFQWLINIIRLLVFLNCALQPIIYLIISSRLRQSVMKSLKICLKCKCKNDEFCSPSSFQQQNVTQKRLYCERKHYSTRNNQRYLDHCTMPHFIQERLRPNIMCRNHMYER